ncbi:MAG: hypothetical protein OXG39_09990 [Chloroflexi bacterium]|nr:hypothetical protein [Chloroflexota bacterium]
MLRECLLLEATIRSGAEARELRAEAVTLPAVTLAAVNARAIEAAITLREVYCGRADRRRLAAAIRAAGEATA